VRPHCRKQAIGTIRQLRHRSLRSLEETPDSPAAGRRPASRDARARRGCRRPSLADGCRRTAPVAEFVAHACRVRLAERLRLRWRRRKLFSTSGVPVKDPVEAVRDQGSVSATISNRAWPGPRAAGCRPRRCDCAPQGCQALPEFRLDGGGRDSARETAPPRSRRAPRPRRGCAPRRLQLQKGRGMELSHRRAVSCSEAFADEASAASRRPFASCGVSVRKVSAGSRPIRAIASGQQPFRGSMGASQSKTGCDSCGRGLSEA